ncbi:uncharacterized protein [Zea mays]|uniref:Uncharacterized protein n=1 Tax=Zea mays TaxID=4577 RepID=A0A804QM52_MAIZE|nr:uncharacterized protein LOC103635545 isoform X1 [Zea mays]|eukprot:XP_020398153.1 uncharacterized protein LOC103635545 isoform X1 [Zea mays]
MELAASASASVCSAYHHLSVPAAAADAAATDRGGAQETTTTRLDRRRGKRAGGGCAGLRRRCYKVLKQQRTRLYILRRYMPPCWIGRSLRPSGPAILLGWCLVTGLSGAQLVLY